MSLADDLGLVSGECMAWIGYFWNVSVGAGNGAKNLTAIAQQNGWNISASPTIGSIAVFQPGQFPLASGGTFTSDQQFGHVGMVTGVGQGGAYTISEMNAIAGYGNVDTQTLSPGGPVAFVTPPASLQVDSHFSQQFGQGIGQPGAPSGGAVLASNTGGNNNPKTFSANTCKSLSEATGGGIPILSGANGFFQWIAQGCVWKRIFIYGVAGGLIIFGLKFLGEPGPANIITHTMREVAPTGGGSKSSSTAKSAPAESEAAEVAA